MHQFVEIPTSITKSDTVVVSDTYPLASQCGLYIVGAGNIAIELPDNGPAGASHQEIIQVAALSYHRFPIRRLLSTGTTATGIFILTKFM